MSPELNVKTIQIVGLHCVCCENIVRNLTPGVARRISKCLGMCDEYYRRNLLLEFTGTLVSFHSI